MTARGALPWSIYRHLRFPSRFFYHLQYEDESGNSRTVSIFLSYKRARREMDRRNGIA